MIFWGVLRFDLEDGLKLHTGVSSFKHNLDLFNSDIVPAIDDNFNVWTLNHSFADLPKTDYLLNDEVIAFLESRKQDLRFFITSVNTFNTTHNVLLFDKKIGKKIPPLKGLINFPNSTELTLLIEQV